MVLIALTFVAVILLTSSSDFEKGWFAALGASFIFGSTGVPMKLPPSTTRKLQPLHINPILFAVWSSVGIFLVSCPLVVFLSIKFKTGFEFKPWALLGSTNIIVISYLTFHAVQMLGYARAPAIWAR
jgi:hypothetical protein